ncbi:MAG: phage portal protein [Phycisphaerae bacterium]
MSLFHLAESRSAGAMENPAIPITPMQLDGLFGYVPTASGISVNEKTAMTFAAYFAAIKIIAESVASMRLQIFETTKAKTKTVVKSPLSQLLAKRPNPQMNATSFWETIVSHMAGWGNGYARIQRNGIGVPVALWPLPPAQTRPERRGGVLTFKSNGEIFEADEILHFPAMGYDGLVGYSPVSLHRETIGTGIAGQRQLGSFYGNGQTMSGVLQHPASLSPQAIENIRSQFLARQAGVGNAYKPLILEEGMTWKQTGMNLNDAQYIQTMNFTVADISRIFRVPAYMLGDSSKTTNSNMETQGSEFVTFTLRIYMSKIEDEVDFKLLADQPGDLESRFDDSYIVKGDATSRQAAYASGRQWGYLSANDVRAREGMNPIGPEGDIYLSPINMETAKDAAAPPPPPPAKEPPKEEPKPPVAAPPMPMPMVAPTAMPSTPLPEKNSFDRREKTKKVFARLFADTVMRLGRKELAAATTAHQKRSDKAAMEAWAKKFSDEYRATLGNALAATFSSFIEALHDGDGMPIEESVRATNLCGEAVTLYQNDFKAVLARCGSTDFVDAVKEFTLKAPARYAVAFTELPFKELQDVGKH